MNNALDRLLDGMAEALRREVIPHVSGEFARGQAYGVVFMLESLKRRASWSNAYLGEGLAAQAELARELGAVADRLPGAPSAPAPPAALPPPAAELERARDDGDARVAALVEWLAARPAGADPDALAAADAAIARYIRRQLRHELQTSARPMFEAISTGQEPDRP